MNLRDRLKEWSLRYGRICFECASARFLRYNQMPNFGKLLDRLLGECEYCTNGIYSD